MGGRTGAWGEGRLGRRGPGLRRERTDWGVDGGLGLGVGDGPSPDVVGGADHDVGGGLGVGVGLGPNCGGVVGGGAWLWWVDWDRAWGWGTDRDVLR